MDIKFQNKKKIEAVMNNFGFDFKDSFTSPELLIEVLKNDMFLYDFPLIREALEKHLEEQVALNRLYDNFVLAMTQKCSPLADLFIYTYDNNLHLESSLKRDSQDLTARCRRLVHHIFLTDYIINFLVEDSSRFTQLQEYFKEKKRKLGIYTKYSIVNFLILLIKTGKIFGSVKFATIEIAFDIRNNLRKKGSIKTADIANLAKNLQINILEAGFTEMRKGNTLNAYAAQALAAAPLTAANFQANDPKKIIEYHLSREWCNLYSSWNMAFIFSLEYWLIFIPTLLFPTLYLTDSKNYLYHRSTALYLALHQCLFKIILNKVEKWWEPPVEIVMEAWHKINHDYAKELILKTYNIDIDNKVDFRKLLKQKISEVSGVAGLLFLIGL